MIVIIPARGGSKRLPRKNLREFRGVPLIVYSIRAALASPCVSEVIVSTDCSEIAEVAKTHGATVPFERPRNLADDRATLVDVMQHAAQWLTREGRCTEYLCCLLATAPFVTVADLHQATTMIRQGDWNYVFTATTHAYPIFRSFTRRPEGGLQMIFPEHYGTRSQDLPEALHDAGQFYVGKASAWMERLPVFAEKSTIIELPRWRVQDIDSEADWIQAELLAEILERRKL